MVTVDLTSSEKAAVITGQLLRFTPLGWLMDNISLIIISIIILFFGFQVIMMDTKRIPAQHPVRRYTRPFTLFAPSPDGKSRFHRGDRKSGKGAGSQEGSDSSGTVEEIAERKQGRTGGSFQDVRKDIPDRAARRGGEPLDKKPIETIEEETLPDVEGEYQETKEMERAFGFPLSLRDRYEPLGVAGDDSYARVYKVRK